jgi:hypothetical protein
MAKIIDLQTYNGLRGSDTIISTTFENQIGLSNTFKFENKNGDNIVITPKELRGHLVDFLKNEIDLNADSTVELCKGQLERRLDVQISKLEEHINDKINKMTQDIISATTSRLIQEEVNRRVDEKLRKIRKAIDESF